MNKKGLIVLGHGSRAPEATQTLAEITAMVAAKTEYEQVAYASLQLSEPGLPAVVEEMVGLGIREILVLPFLIAVGQHLKEDIPAELAQLAEKYPGLQYKLAGPLGADPRLAEVLLDRAAEAEQER